MSDCKQQLLNNVNYWADGITDGSIDLEDLMTNDCLDIEFVLDSQKRYIGAVLLVAFGGPNIRINTRWGQVEGHWEESCYRSFTDNIGLDDYIKDCFGFYE